MRLHLSIVSLFPTDPLQRAQSRYLIHHWATRTNPVQQKAILSLDASDASKRHQDYIAELEKVDNLLRNAPKSSEPGLDGKGPYFLGSRFTFADLALASFLTRVPLVEHFQKDLGFKLPSKEENPRLARFIEWQDAVVKRESVVKHLPSKEELIEVNEKAIK